MMQQYNRSTVQVLHLPTGVKAVCESERSQHRNKAKALELLKARLWAREHLLRPAEVVRCYYL